MKSIPVSKFAAPSPLVLSFLRQQVRCAFGPARTPCAAPKGQRCGYATTDTRSSADAGATALSKSLAPRRGVSRMTKPDTVLSPSQTFTRSATNLQHSSPSHRRRFSTTSFSKAWQLFGGRKPSRSPSLSPPLPLSDVMGDAPIPIGFESLGRMTRSANELKMRCTELDDQGNVTMVSGEFKKSELIAKVCDSANNLSGLHILTDSSTACSLVIFAKLIRRSSRISSSDRLPSL